jgi:hypothetical protein
MHTPLHNPSLERQAQRRANAQLGWLVHAGVYLAVNTGLLLLAWNQGRSWAVIPALGWGLGLAAHGLAVSDIGGKLCRWLLERERGRMGLRQRP